MRKIVVAIGLLLVVSGATFCQNDTSAGWIKYAKSPVLGGDLGTIFDISVLKEDDGYKMWCSWRDKASIALSVSSDGFSWSTPEIALAPNPATTWESDINRPGVIYKDGLYHMWYTGQANNQSWIGYATSTDGKNWTRMSKTPVLSPTVAWEKVAVMCPSVIWDEEEQIFKMWYSGGDQYEPDAIGYATSKDGLNWTKYFGNPVFKNDPGNTWEQYKVTACQIIKEKDDYLMFYIGFRDIDYAQIGIARSKDGINDWQRHPQNPVIRPGSGWDASAVYKPYAIFDGNQWLLWYNGRNGGVEQIGMATHEGEDLGFPAIEERTSILDPQSYKHYIDSFNANDNELYPGTIPNSDSWLFLSQNIPFLDCPDTTIEQTYYFRWWTYRKHIKSTSKGYVITEFLPSVPWAGNSNTISCAAAHHIYEGRWLNNGQIISDYSKFWFIGSTVGGGDPRAYSFWPANAIYNYFLVHPDTTLLQSLYSNLRSNLMQWESTHRDAAKQLFWQTDDRDGMESSISGALTADGSGYRATINSYMYGEAAALANIAGVLGKASDQLTYLTKADGYKQQINTQLWDNSANFYKVIPKNGKNQFSPARELHGYTPWYFNIPPDDYAVAWLQLKDPQGFYAPYGPTTAEQRASGFQISYTGHECQWNGPSWPYATSITLTGLANLLNNDSPAPLNASDYFDLLQIYSKSHFLKKADGTTVPWIDENINPFTGDWISRTILMGNGTWPGGIVERGKDYNHSTYCDLIITGLIGIRPQEGDQLIVNPLVPQDTWDYFCLDNVSYKGHKISVVYDKDGSRYNVGQGFKVFVDGIVKGESPTVEKMIINLGTSTSIKEVSNKAAQNISVYSGENAIVLSQTNNTPVQYQIYDLAGMMLTQGFTTGANTTISLNTGIYIIKIASLSFATKVIVR